ncbi:hypothetical protein [Achromobacter insuavis]|uniref:hypothetical protein n=1 Tax=Achromobacter insuavis TaxID=1287735 RepID=UPI0029D47522|nr:hypothetical protein [Achromobacter sp.]MCG2601521.1 hypothetical protein [Achromobacter sp.]
MEIDDHGKERRNALLVSAAVCSAAFLQLKMPSFLAEYIKFEVAPEHAYRVWLLAASLTLYVLMRYHFSDGRVAASASVKLTFAKTLDKRLSMTLHQESSSETLAREDWMDRVRRKHGTSFAQPNFLGPKSMEPFDWHVFNRGALIYWRIKAQILDNNPGIERDFPHESASTFALSWAQCLLVRLQAIAFRAFWSKTAWELNTVYLTSIGALSASAIRVYTLYTVTT